MQQIDWASLTNWIVSGLVGLTFGVIGTYVAHRLDRNRDEIQWKREKLDLEQQWAHERTQLGIVWQQKLHELQIQLLGQEHQVRFTRLHEIRAEAIAQLYKEIVKTEQQLTVGLSASLLLKMRGLSKNDDAISNMLSDVTNRKNYFDENRIYFPKAICEKVDKLYSELAAFQADGAMLLTTFEPDASLRLTKLQKQVISEITPLKDDIEREFQTILGAAE